MSRYLYAFRDYRQRTHVAEKTRRMHRLLVVSLATQLLALIFGLILPLLLLVFVGLFLGSSTSNLLVMTGILVMMAESILNFTLTIVLVTPYRKATMRIVRCGRSEPMEGSSHVPIREQTVTLHLS